MRHLAATLVMVIAAGCGGAAQVEDLGAAEYAEEYGGSVSAYRQILSLSSCVELQEQFDIAADNNDAAEPGTSAHRQSLGFMTAAQARMDSLGRC